MKNIILGAVAATALLATNISVMNSAHAAGSCSHLDKGVQFNKTELSAFDKCWLNTHRPDEKSGVDGNVFWVKVGDDFVSMPLIDLRRAGSQSDAKEMAKEKIIDETIVEKIIEITVENGETINALRNQISGFESARDAILENLGVEAGSDALASIQTKIDELQADVSRLMNLPTANSVVFDRYTIANDIATITLTNGNSFEITKQQAIDAFGITIEDGVTQVDVDNVAYSSYSVTDGIATISLTNGNSFTITENEAITAFGISVEDGHRSTVTQRNGTDLFDVTGVNSGRYITFEAHGRALQAVAQIAIDQAVSEEQARNLNNAAIALSREASARGWNTNTTTQDFIDAAMLSTHFEGKIRLMAQHLIAQIPPAQTFDLAQAKLDAHGRFNGNTQGDSYQNGAYQEAMERSNTKDYTVANYVSNGRQVEFTVNGREFRSDWYPAFSDALYHAVDQAVEAAYTEGYNDGYDAGYNDGYTDGYADGYSDGVESVR